MIRAIFEYEGDKANAPRLTIEGADEDQCIERFAEIRRAKWRRFALRDWAYTARSVRAQNDKPLLTANGRNK